MDDEKEKDITIEVGYHRVIINKLFGSQVFANLRIVADPNSNTWVVERENISTSEWVEWVRIPGQINSEDGFW